jgi:transcriptional regulator of acetoin/glycerol metabolism
MVDPADDRPPNILTAHELKDRREPLDKFILGAREEVDRLYGIVREIGYLVLLTDATGVVVDHRGEDGEKSRFEYWGTWLGGVWSEEIEGTNGIGTCIAEKRPVTIHRSQHFRSRNMDLSCSGAPVFGVDGKFDGGPGCLRHRSRTLRGGARSDWRPDSMFGARDRGAALP